MMFNYPFSTFRNKFYPYNYYDYPKNKNNYNISYKKVPDINIEASNTINQIEPSETNIKEQFFSVLGIRLYFDDLIILALLFFLYKEKVKDEGLFICLILLLLS